VLLFAASWDISLATKAENQVIMAHCGGKDKTMLLAQTMVVHVKQR
jgi:hypothetical protein